MAIVATQLTSGADSTNGTVYTTASVSPSGGRLQVLAVYITRSAGIPSTGTTVTGCGLTWAQITTVSNNTGSDSSRLMLFRAMGSPSAGALTITAPEGQLRAGWSLTEFENVETSGSDGADAVIQSANDQNGGATLTGATITLSAFGNAANAAFGAIGVTASGAVTEGSGFTELSENTVETVSQLQAEWKDAQDTTVDWSWGSASVSYVALAIEIKFVEPPVRDNRSYAFAI